MVTDPNQLSNPGPLGINPLVGSDIAKGLGGDILPEMTVDNLAWIYRDAIKRGITPGAHLNAIVTTFRVTTFRVASALGPGPDNPNAIIDQVEGEMQS